MRSESGADIAAQYATMTRQQFDHERGLPVVVPVTHEQDMPLLLTALGRSSISVAPLVINNNSENDLVSELASNMGARVIEQPVRGQTGAIRTGLAVVAGKNPNAPVMITDDDALPGRHWANTMFRKTKHMTVSGGIAYGSSILEHGPSVPTDTLRTLYALGGDVLRRTLDKPPKPRGSNTIYWPDMEGKALWNIMQEPPNVFPSDVAIRDCVVMAGGEQASVMDWRAIVCTRGDRFTSVNALVKDLVTRSEARIELYQEDQVVSRS